VNILSTLLRADAGTTSVNGFDVAAQPASVRESISITGQFAAVDEVLTGRENLVLVARLRQLSGPGGIADDLLERFSLTDAAARGVSTYSGGMRRRLDIAMSLIGNPPVIFLDEPTTGLDPRARIEVWQAVRELAAHGTTVLLTTQYLDEADRLAERLAVIDHGRVIAEGTSRELKASVGANALHVRLADATQRAVAQEVVSRVLGDGVLPVTDPLVVTARLARQGDAAEVLSALNASNVEVAEFSVGTPSLDEVFLALTGRPAEDAEQEKSA
jgi:ABC-2 type transport system ATP-binding protein